MARRDVLSTEKVKQKCPEAKYHTLRGDSSYKKIQKNWVN